MAKQTKYNPDYHIPWAWSLAIKGATDAEIADAMDVSVRTINRWKFEMDKNGKVVVDADGSKVLSPFGKAVMEGKQSADAKVERSLFDRTQPFTYTEEERIIEYDTDGTVKPVKVRSITKTIPADTMACIYWLNNRSKATGEWTQKQEVTVTRPKEELQDQLNSIAALINADDRPPRTIESIEAEIDRRGNE